VRLGGSPGDKCLGVDLDAIPDQTLCDALYLPPMYLVCLRGYKPSAFRVGPAWPYPRNS
jgi:hypothetical protein